MKRWRQFLLSMGILVLGIIGTALANSGSARYLFGVFTGRDANSYFGSAIVGNADWIGSGKKYIAVGASGFAGELVRSGAVYLYDSLTSDVPAMTLKAIEKGDLFGYNLSGGGDFNGDAIADLAVSAPCEWIDPTKRTPGKVYLFLGGEGFATRSPIAFSANESGDAFGLSVSLEADLNGDGLADLVVGAPYSNRGGALAGTAYIWWGTKDAKNGMKPDIVLRQGTTNDMLGSALAVGDLNGDGQADLAVGAPQHNLGDKMPGSVFIYYGGSRAKWEQASLILSGEATSFYDHFGAAVAIVGDVNGDGGNDLLVGAPRVKTATGEEGRVYLFSGGAALDAKADGVMNGSMSLGHFGSAIYAVGDLNEDGKADFAVQTKNGAEGRGVVSFYYGGWETAFYEMEGEAVGDIVGNSVAALGDMNGDGTKDVAVGARWSDAGARDAGRVYLLSFPR
ncbi:MAG: FG-GAP-like repeat-containing protein [bacterium]